MIESEDVLIRVTTKRFVGIFKKAAEINDFDVDLFFKLVKMIAVSGGGLLIVSLLDGTEIEVEVEIK